MLIPVLLACLCLTGCESVQKLFHKSPPPTSLLGTNVAQPTLEQLITAVNQNSRNIRNFSTGNASILMPGMWAPLHTRLTFESPKRLRIQGFATTLSGQEFDFGSNDEIFWLWSRRGTNEMWYCRHELYPISPVRSVIPFDPDWLIEALGIVEFKPTDQHVGPNRLSDGNWEIMSYCQTPSGQFIKRTVIDSKGGWVVRQELFTPQNVLTASAESSDLKLDPSTNIVYAKRVTVQCQGMDGSMTIDFGTPTFNSSMPFASDMFLMPVFEGYRAVDLGSSEYLQQRGVVMPTQMPINGVPVPEANIRTVVR